MSNDDDAGIPRRPDTESGDAAGSAVEDARPGDFGRGGSASEGFTFSATNPGGTTSGEGYGGPHAASGGPRSGQGATASGPPIGDPHSVGPHVGGPHSTGARSGGTPPSPPRTQLRRERQSRMIAGVCGGLGRHLDVDPVIFRIMFAILTFFGGLGLLVYAALWLFLPADGEHESEAQRLLTGASALIAIAITVVLVLGFMAMVSTISDGFGRAVPLLLVAAAIIAVLVWRSENQPYLGPNEGQAEFPEAEFEARDWGSDGDQSRPKPWWQRPVSGYPTPSTDTGPISGAEFSGGIGRSPTAYGDTTESRGSADRGAGATGGYGSARTRETGFGGAGTSTDGLGANRAGAAVPMSRGRRVSGIALSGSLLVVGILGVLVAAGVIHIGWSAGFALTVMAIGAGMTIGGLYGRTRWLIPVGLVLIVPLIVGNALGVPMRGQTGSVDWAPGSAAAAASSTYELAAGRGSLDLTTIDPAGGVVHVTAHVGVGRLVITVPQDVAVVMTAHVGIGQIQFVDGSTEGGLDITKSFDSDATGKSHGTIALDLKVGAGDVEVDRVTS
jgi:phage shock protein PspC (stress-responsive transcriptional regulator)